MSCHVMSCHVMSCHVMSCHVTSCLVMSSHVTSCHVLSCHVMSRHDTLEFCSRIFLPSLLNSSIMAAGWQRRGFRNRGPMRESGSERRSRCGAARIATVPRGRRGGQCDLGIVLRGRLRGSGVLEVCRGCVAALCRGIGFGARFVHAWQTCVSRGRLRGSCVLGVMSRACRGHAAALCRGDWVRGAFGTRMVNVRFAWQAAGIVRAGRSVAGVSRACRGAVPWGLGSGRVLYTHGQRAFRVAGCGDRACWEACRGCVAGMPRRCAVGTGFGANVRFAWQAAGIGCVERVSRACRGRAGGALPWGLESGRVACVVCAALCHGDCCWACRVGGGMPWGLLGGASSQWRRVSGIADQGVVWVAPCLGDC